MSGNKVVYTKKVYEQDGCIIRSVKDIFEAKKIIEILSKNNILGISVVDTKVYSEAENLLTHENLEGIIYSEEYTSSMAYDVAQKALDISLLLLGEGIYCWDMFPHNFTFNNSRWILYDFDAMSLKPVKIKTQIRGFFKIVLSSFEFLKRVERKDLQQCFLNRVKTVHLMKMIPPVDWFRLFVNKNYCFLLYRLKMYKQVYRHLLFMLKTYRHLIKREEYKVKLSQLDFVRFNHINTLLNNHEADKIFCIGETAARWAINTHNNNFRKMIYAGDYDLTDKFYNTIVNNNLKNITIGELFPLSENDKIPASYKYRAIYDIYTKMRFSSSAAVFLNDIPENQNSDEFLNHLSAYANKILIIHFSENNKQRYFEKLSELYNKVEFIYSISLIVAYERKNNISIPEIGKYTNYNRGDNSLSQTEEIMQILKKN